MKYYEHKCRTKKYLVFGLYTYLLSYGNDVIKVNKYKMYILCLDYLKWVYYIGVVDITNCKDYTRYKKIWKLLYGF